MQTYDVDRVCKRRGGESSSSTQTKARVPKRIRGNLKRPVKRLPLKLENGPSQGVVLQRILKSREQRAQRAAEKEKDSPSQGSSKKKNGWIYFSQEELFPPDQQGPPEVEAWYQGMLFGACLEKFRASEEKDFEDTSGCHLKIFPKKHSKDTSGHHVEIYRKKPSEDSKDVKLRKSPHGTSSCAKSPPRTPDTERLTRPPGMPAFGDGSCRNVSSSGKPGPSKPSPNFVPFRPYAPQGKWKASGNKN